MQGTITVTNAVGVRVHTYTAPEDGWCVNSHVIELPNELVVIDAQYTLCFAQELIDYTAPLNKKISRLYITHYHPDHLLGAAAFDVPIYALQEVIRKIEAVGDRVAREEHEKHGATIPDHAERPSRTVVPGDEVIDGIKFNFVELQHAETEYALVVGLREANILITQDLLYDKVHVFVGEKAFDTWIAALGEYEALPYTHILPGHGHPGGKELFHAMKQYIVTAKHEFESAQDSASFIKRMTDAFPDYHGRALLEHEQRFLFPTQT